MPRKKMDQGSDDESGSPHKFDNQDFILFEDDDNHYNSLFEEGIHDMQDSENHSSRDSLDVDVTSNTPFDADMGDTTILEDQEQSSKDSDLRAEKNQSISFFERLPFSVNRNWPATLYGILEAMIMAILELSPHPYDDLDGDFYDTEDDVWPDVNFKVNKEDIYEAASESIKKQREWDERRREEQRLKRCRYIMSFRNRSNQWHSTKIPRHVEPWEHDSKEHTKFVLKNRPKLHPQVRENQEAQAAKEKRQQRLKAIMSAPPSGSGAIARLNFDESTCPEDIMMRNATILKCIGWEETREEIKKETGKYPTWEPLGPTKINRDFDDYVPRKKGNMTMAQEVMKEMEMGINPWEFEKKKSKEPVLDRERFGRPLWRRLIFGPNEHLIGTGNPKIPTQYQFQPGIFRLNENGEQEHICRRNESPWEHVYFSNPRFIWPDDMPKPPGKSARDRFLQKLRDEEFFNAQRPAVPKRSLFSIFQDKPK